MNSTSYSLSSGTNTITLNASGNVSLTGNLTAAGSGPWCATHGFSPCYCGSTYGGIVGTSNAFCGTCGQSYNPTYIHACPGPTTIFLCGYCGGAYSSNTLHQCSTTGFQSGTWTTTNTLTNVFPIPIKDCKELVTDAEIQCEGFGTNYTITIPAFLAECFIHVSWLWVPLCPLVFSGTYFNEDKMKFFLVREIKDKAYGPDGKVTLTDCTVIEVTDNLDVIQLTERAKAYLGK